METMRLKSVIDSQSSTKVMSYCIIRSKLRKRAKNEDRNNITELETTSKQVSQADISCQQQLDRLTPATTTMNATPPPKSSSSQPPSQTVAILFSPESSPEAALGSEQSFKTPPSTFKTTTTNSCQLNRSLHQDGGHLNKIKRGSSWSFNWSLLFTLIIICLSPTANNNNIDWRHDDRSVSRSSTNRLETYQNVNTPIANKVEYSSLLDSIFKLVAPTRGGHFRRRWPSAGGVQLAEAQYRPEWPSKSLQQEIFLLNLEDGYFGCQVNESQDFLQLFELSRLCDGQAQCYLGTDEMAAPLKCNNRERCGSYQNSRGQPESIQCVNGVCLDGLCYCNDGFGGKSCDVPDENECKFRPCDVFAHCTNTMGSYYCSCFPGYDGDGMHCQDINECEIPNLAALCSDNSECCNLPGHFVCKCKPGYQQSGQSQSSLTGAPSGNTTVLCTDIDECLDERSCGKGAICENLPGSFRCSCPPGFTGDPSVECIDMDECRNNPCGVGAQCTNIPGGYRCSCASGFERNPSLPANLFGTIQSSVSMSSQIAEMSNSSIVACLDINECGGKAVCGSGAQCINTPGAYFCQCPPNYTGNPKVACVDIDECAAHACGPNAQCKNTPGNYKCECKQGYTGNAYLAEGCQDEDECLRKDTCGLNAQCFNTLGSYQCSCQSGYSGDPYTNCTDIDECSGGNPCGQGAQCHNLAGGYKCACPEKYLARGTPDMGCERAAVDIGCSGDYDCTRNALCVNSTCQCKLGYQINGIECVDVDECALNHQQQSIVQQAPIKAFTKLSSVAVSNESLANSLCGPEAICQNTDGSFRCECKSGYEKVDLSLAVSKCRDINECEQSNPCGQNSKCFNTDGSFKCACSDGFIPIDPVDITTGCKSPCDGVNCGQHATCKPHGEEAACVCKPGFTFDPNNIKLGCVDINECDTNYGAAGLCGQRAVCTNVPGSYRCHCPTGYSGDAYRYCEDINECDRRFGVFGQCGEMAICNNTAGSYSCACAPGYAGDPRSKCFDIDECSTKFGPNGKCGPSAICTNAPAKFSCRCPAGYSGDPYDRCTPEQPACSSPSDCATNQVCQSGRCHCPFAQQQSEAGDSGSPGAECRHPCDRTECGAHATCRLDSDNQAICVCDGGYMAPSDGRSGCVDVNECIQGVTLSGITPLSALTSGRGGVAVGPITTTLSPGGQATGSNSSHPCGRNALCRNQPGSFDCVCPPGYSGNAYEACTIDIRSQQQPVTQTTTSTTSTTNSGVFGNYQQEPRTTACSEPCQRGYVCSDGQCVKPDSCRDNQDCRSSMACEHVNQLLGFQCVNVCDLNQCGPDARCTPLNHKPICSCNSTAGYAGDPYDLITGCQLQTTDVKTQQRQQTSTTTSSFGQQFSTLTTKHEQLDSHKTAVSNKQQQQQQQHGDISTTSLDFGSPINQQQPTITTTTTSSMSSNNSALDQLQRQQQQQIYEQQRQQQSQTKRPNQPLIAYELPLPTTPVLPQFGPFGQTTTTTIFGQQNFSSSQQTNEQKQTNQQLVQSPPAQVLLSPLVPQLTQTTIANQLTTTTVSRQQHQQQHYQQQQQQQEQQQQQQQQQTTPSLFANKRKPQPTNQQANVISNNQLSTSNRQDSMIDMSQQKQQQKHESHEERQNQQQAAKDQQIVQNAVEQHVQNQQIMSQQQDNADIIQSFNQFSNKSAFITNYGFNHKQVTCTSDQHCPGNLFCLGSELSTKANQKICGCPSGYRREADYCFMHRINCTSSALCKAREECISSNILQQYYSSGSSLEQQFSTSQIGSQQFTLSNGDEYTGICICPRGYKLTASGIACIDRNECDEGTPCAVGAICQNKIGSYECVCPPGSVGEPYTKTCEPIVKHECQSNSDCPNDRECDLVSHKCVSPCYVCGPRAICTAANHVAICLCPPRYTGNAIDLVYGCQEPITTTTSSTTTTTSTSTTTAKPPSTSTAVGVPITTLLPTTTVAPMETTTPELVEFRTIPPSELFVMCLADGIQVEVQLGGFDGIIYVKGHSQDPKCRKLVMSSNANEFVDFKVQFGHCDLIHRDGEAGFVLVIQKHPKLVTYRARAYHVKCVYNTGERTVTLGFNVSMITTSGTIANTGPPPTCLMSITALDGREVTSAEIGQDLLLRVDVQPDSIYGGFARSCEAKTMDDGGEYQYEVTDANGCATDASIFSDWKYDEHRKSLVARFNAFKFPSSNNLRFQCNIRVCFGSCPAVNCNGIDAYGRRRRRRDAPAIESSGGAVNASEVDIDTPADELIVTDAFKEGALREEIMVQSNAILTFDRKEASLPQQRPQVEDIEFVCLPRLGIIMSIALTTLLALLALAIATSCWCFTKRKRQNRNNGPLPHPVDFPNPLMRSSSASTLREPIYGP